jgi:hypothetical protein
MLPLPKWGPAGKVGLMNKCTFDADDEVIATIYASANNKLQLSGLKPEQIRISCTHFERKFYFSEGLMSDFLSPEDP